MEPYWDKQKYKDYFNTNNFHYAKRFLFTFPYGVNRKTGELVNDHDEHLSLIKEGNLIGGDVTDKESDFFDTRIMSSSSSHIILVYSYLPSLTSNTNCYETNKIVWQKDFLNLINLSCKKNFQREKVII